MKLFQNIKNKFLRRIVSLTVKISVIIILVLIIAHFAFVLFAAPFLKNKIINSIEEQSKGLYVVDIKDVSVDLFIRSIFLKDISIQPQKSVLNKLNEKGQLKSAVYELIIPEMNILKISILDKLFKDKLKIDSVVFDAPEIKVVKLAKKNGIDKKNGSNPLKDDLYPIISTFFSSLEISKIHIKNGSFNLSRKKTDDFKTSSIGDVSIELYNFRLDSSVFNSNNGDLFYSDDVNIRVSDFMRQLNDSIHIVKAGLISLSYKDSEIRIKDASISPENKLKNLRSSKLSLINASIPEIKIEVEDINHLLLGNRLEIQKLNLYRPDIKVVKQSGFADLNFDLYELIKGNLKLINVNSFKIFKAKFSLFEHGIQEAVVKSDLSVMLKDFKLDSITKKDKDRLLYSQNVKLLMDNYSMRLSDKVHKLEAGHLLIFTDQSEILARDIRMKPINNNLHNFRNNKNVYDIVIPDFKMKNVDLKKIFHEKILTIDELSMDKPNVVIRSYIKNDSNKKVENSIKSILNSYLKSVYIKDVILKDAFADYKSYGVRRDDFRIGNISVKLKNFKLETDNLKQWNRIFHAQHVELNAHDYYLALSDDFHAFKADNVKISTSRSELKVQGLKLEPKEKSFLKTTLDKKISTVYDIGVDKLILKGFNIHKAYINKDLRIKHIDFEKADVKIINFREDSGNQSIDDKKSDFYSLLSTYLEVIDIGTVKLKDGRFDFINRDKKKLRSSNIKNVYIVLSNFKLDSNKVKTDNRILYSDDIEMKLKDYTFTMADNVHKVKVDEIGLFTSKSEVYAKNLRLQADKNSEFFSRSKSIYSIQLPDLQMKGVNIEKAFRNRVLEIDDVYLGKSRIAYLQQFNKNNTKEKADYSFGLPKGFSAFKIKRLHLDTSSLVLSRLNKTKAEAYSNADIMMKIYNFHLDSGLTGIGKKIADFTEMNIDMFNYKLRLPDRVHELKSEKIVISAKGSALRAHNLSIQSLNRDELKKHGLNPAVTYNVKVPLVYFEGFDYDKFFNESDIDITAVDIKEPDITVNIYSKKYSAANIFDYKNIVSTFDNAKLFFSAGIIRFNNAKFKYNNFIDEKVKTYLLNQISGRLDNFLIDPSTKKDKDRILFSKDVNLSVKDYEFYLPDSMYKIHFDELGISLAGSQMRIDSFSLTPQYSKYSFSKIVGHEVDVVSITGKSAVFNGFDFVKFINEGDIDVNEAHFDGVKINMFRDKRAVFPANTYMVLPQNMLVNAKRYINFNEITVKNSYASYEEHVEKAVKPGMVYFQDLSGRITDLTNDKDRINSGAITRVHGEGKLMNSGRITADFEFPLKNENNLFKVKGKIEEMDITKINPMIENVAFISVKDGKMLSMEFEFKAHEHFALGKLIFRYKNFKIVMITKKMKHNKKPKKEISTLLANIMVRSNNPNNEKPPREGEIFFMRDKSKSIFNFMWKSMLSGMKSTFGLKPKKTVEVKKLNDKK